MGTCLLGELKASSLSRAARCARPSGHKHSGLPHLGAIFGLDPFSDGPDSLSGVDPYQARYGRLAPVLARDSKFSDSPMSQVPKSKSSRPPIAKTNSITLSDPTYSLLPGNASCLPLCIPNSSVDVIVTSPPYWRKRDYGHEGQLGQEKTPGEYVIALVDAMENWRRVLKPSGSIFLNIGDTYWKKSLVGIPSLVEAEAHRRGWLVRNRIIWVKKTGMPEPADDRLAGRHEYVLHFAVNGYYYDLFGYAQEYSGGKRGANPGDVWEIQPERNLGRHLAPFPSEIARRSMLLACPELACIHCGKPKLRLVERSMEPDPNRPQSVRAMHLAKEHGLTPAHLAAIRATGISDAGKARKVQSGTDRNSEEVKRLAREAKKILGGYFREFTFTKQISAGWVEQCGCRGSFVPGVVLDPFVGTGTTIGAAYGLRRSAIGVDLDISQAQELLNGLQNKS